MTYDPVDTDDDGTVDADVDNTNTTTDSLDTEGLTNRGVKDPVYASGDDDLSDVSVHFQRKSPSSTTEYVLLDVSDGPKTLLRADFIGPINATDGTARVVGPVIVDGTTTPNFPNSNTLRAATSDGATIGFVPIHSILYDNSIKLEWEHDGNGNDATAIAYTLGSGPITAYIVSDGKEPYSEHKNVSEEQIDELNIPDGYKIVKDPDIPDSCDSAWECVWDDERSKFIVE